MSDLAPRKLVLASDHAGFALKEYLKKALASWGIEVDDLGTHDEASVDYPDYAHRLAESVIAGHHDMGLLVCGTGLGMSMAANRHRGIRAALCTDGYQAQMARLHNDANVLCLGSRVLGTGLAEDILRSFIATSFEGGRHGRRVDRIEVSRS